MQAHFRDRTLGSGFGSLAESDERPLVYIMTYHSAKGLDFETVFLPQLNEGIDFWPKDAELDKKLFFVATTRSRRNLFMSYHKRQPHSYIRNMPQHLLKKIDCAETNSQSPSDEEMEVYF